MNSESEIILRPTTVQDLETLFTFLGRQRGYTSGRFYSKDPTDKLNIAKYSKLLQDPTVNNRTILLENKIIGSLAKFVMSGDNEITYWIDKNYWEKVSQQSIEEILSHRKEQTNFWESRVWQYWFTNGFWKNVVSLKLGQIKVLRMRGRRKSKSIFIRWVNVNEVKGNLPTNKIHKTIFIAKICRIAIWLYFCLIIFFHLHLMTNQIQVCGL